MKYQPLLIAFFALTLFVPSCLLAQAPPVYSSSETELMLRRLKVCGTVLYVAAHPDDENTRFITYMARERKTDVYYLSLTRGDGGQNLVGPELGDGLGLIRTNELLAARKTDGGKQLFSRARDFGFSKNPQETFTIWPREEVLRDVVRIVRQLQPDIIVTRFSPDPANTHGHHTASAQLALEAFKAAADPNRFPDDLKRDGSKPHQAKRIFWNISSFFFQGREKEFNPDKYLKLDIGNYDPLTGKNYAEIAADSRSMHKSQGFGSAGARGPSLEYFQLLAGDSTKSDILDGINLSWNRLPKGKVLEAMLDSAISEYRPLQPEKAVPKLLHALVLLRTIDTVANAGAKGIIQRKTAQISEAISACLGLRIEAAAVKQTVQPNASLTVAMELVTRGKLPVKVASLSSFHHPDTLLGITLTENKPVKFNLAGTVKSAGFSDPYWLRNKASQGLFNVPFGKEYARNSPENYYPSVSAAVSVNGYPFVISSPVRYRYVDPVKGELYQPLEILPEITLEADQKVLLLSPGQAKTVRIKITAQGPASAGAISMKPLTGIQVSPPAQLYPALAAGKEFEAEFTVTAQNAATAGTLALLAVSSKGDTFSRGIQRIRYDHIPNQLMLPPAQINAVPVNLVTVGKRIGYIMGAGDDVPEALRLMGYKVDLLTAPEVSAAKLAVYQAVVVGIRAYNQFPWLKAKKPELMAYMEQGGNVIVQYNTANFLSGGASALDSIGPFPMKVSNDRVTVEGSQVRFLYPEHPILNRPNRLSTADFEGWIQERGLYFPKEWAADYTPLFGMNDPGEPETKGALLVASVGKGNYIYTGISFFRELPAGVPGAYRLFANMLALSNNMPVTKQAGIDKTRELPAKTELKTVLKRKK